MRLEFPLAFADFRAAFRLYRSQSLIGRLNPFIWPILTVLCLGLAIVSNVKSELFAQAVGIGVASAWLSVGLPIARLVNPFRSYRRIVPKAQSTQRCFAEIDDEHVVFGVDGVFEFRYSWKGIRGFAQNKRITLLFTSKYSFLLFPTNAMTSQQAEELKMIVARRLGKA